MKKTWLFHIKKKKKNLWCSLLPEETYIKSVVVPK